MHGGAGGGVGGPLPGEPKDPWEVNINSKEIKRKKGWLWEDSRLFKFSNCQNYIETDSEPFVKDTNCKTVIFVHFFSR